MRGEDAAGSRVVIAGGPDVSYPETPPFSPSEPYPEYPFRGSPLSRENRVYAAVREALAALGLDAAGFGSPGWNPLGCVIGPGDRVLIKPNAVMDRNLSGGDPFAVITHASVIRAVADYALIALSGTGSLVIADAPQFNSDFGAYLGLTRLESVRDMLAGHGGTSVDLLDLRAMTAVLDPSTGIYPARGVSRREGDPAGYRTVDLGAESMLAGLPGLERLYGADYDCSFTRMHHCGDRHEYRLSRTALESDVIISLPKLKTHRKVGVTLNVKGLVGLNGDKNYLAHFRVGPPAGGGDQYPDGIGSLRRWSRTTGRAMGNTLLGPRRKLPEKLYLAWSALRSLSASAARRLGLLRPPQALELIDNGDWPGNDTAWRMAVDLLRIAMYASADGIIGSVPARRIISFVDGVTAGEGNGPLSPDPRRAGVVVAGLDPVSVDIAAAEYMGLHRERIPLLRHFSGGLAGWSGYPGDDLVRVRLPGRTSWADLSEVRGASLGFSLPYGWRPGEEPGGGDAEDAVHQEE